MRNLFISLFFTGMCVHLVQAHPAGSTTLVISQVYGDGGTTGSTYANDYIELYNKGVSPVNLANYSVQYSSGTSWVMTALTAVVLQPGMYYLVKEASNGTGGSALPFADVTGTISMHANNGKIALANSTVPLPNGCTSPLIVDLIGYGNANCYETAVATGGSNVLSIIRTSGNPDTDNNSTDFTTGIPNPRTSSFTLPILINSFIANKKQLINELQWQVNCLSSSVNFELQRSSDATIFEKIYTESASRARCSSSFSFTDNQPPAGNNSYRLKVIDPDKNIYYSKIVTITNEERKKKELSVNPTIVAEQATIKYFSLIQQNINWIITDMHGKRMQKFNTPVFAGENNLPLQVEKLPSGQYQLEGYTVKGKIAATKFVKE